MNKALSVTSLPASPQSTPLRRVAHVDINSYFATILQQENPKLRNRPLVVTKDHGRTCVIAASKEAKVFGIKTGCSLREAKALAPDILVVPAYFDMYLSATKKLQQLFDDLAPNVDIFSLDEAFIDISDCGQLYPDAHAFGALVQSRIKQTLGDWVTCNVGLSYNRLLAKMTSEVSPKGSITEVTPDTKDALLARVPFSAVCGVGMRLEARLARLGVTTPYGINLVSDEELQAAFGPFWSVQLRKIGQGEDPHLFTHQRTTPHMQSIGRSLTCFKVWQDEASIRHTMYNLIEEVIYKARKLGLAGRSVSIGLRGQGEYNGPSPHWFAHRRLPHPVRHSREMFEVLYHQLYQQWRRPWPIVKVSVQLSDLKPWAEMQPVLWPEWHRQEVISTALDTLTHKYGLFTVRPATMLQHQLIRPEVTGYLGDKNYQLGRLG